MLPKLTKKLCKLTSLLSKEIWQTFKSKAIILSYDVKINQDCCFPLSVKVISLQGNHFIFKQKIQVKVAMSSYVRYTAVYLVLLKHILKCSA